MELPRQALQRLTNPGRRTEQLTDNAYTELRAALSAMIINASGMKFQDPLLQIHTKRGEQALFLLRAAGDMLQLTSSSVEYQCLPDTVDPRGPKGK